jgi:hypothetical protein
MTVTATIDGEPLCSCPTTLPVEVVVYDEPTGDGFTYGPRVVATLCPRCIRRVLTPRQRLAELDALATRMHQSMTFDQSLDALVISKADYDAYKSLMDEANLVREAIAAKDAVSAALTADTDTDSLSLEGSAA